MKFSLYMGAVVAAVMSLSTAARDESPVVQDAARLIGADTVRTVQYTATGFDFAIGQQARTDLPWPRFIEKRYTRSIDFEASASRVERVRAQGENPPRGGGGQPIAGEQTQTQLVKGGEGAPWAQQAELLVTPHGFLHAAAKEHATIETQKVGGKRYDVVSLKGPNNARLVGYLNEAHLLERVETWIDNAVLGDTHYESFYSDYRDVGGAKFPFHIVQRQGGHPIYELTVNDVKVNVPVDIPAPPAPNQQAAATEPQKLGDGVYLLSGNYAVIAVDFKDYIVLFESGQNDERATEVIAAARKIAPGKPIRYVVNTHPHFDHSGGLRVFVNEGITILTHQDNRAYLEKVLARPRTLATASVPGAQRKPKVEGVGDKKVLTDGERIVELHRLQNFGHHDGMLVAYFPKEKVLFEADAYNPQAASAAPPNPASPYNLSLLQNIQKLGFDVQRIVPVHRPADDRVITVDELRRWAGQEKVANR